MTARPLIVHVVFGFDTGGLENGVVNLINRLPAEAYRHCVISLTPGKRMAERLTVPCEVIALHKRPGQDWRLLGLLYQLFCRLKPAVVHTRNLSTIEAQVPAWLAKVPCRIHGEHGWDIQDPDGANKKYQWLRRMIAPLVHRFVPLSQLQEHYLERCGIVAEKQQRICNGVDTTRFRPALGLPADWPFGPDERVIMALGRLEVIKNHQLLVAAFIQLKSDFPALAASARLVLVGDGSLRVELEQQVADAGLADDCWFAGERIDTPQLLCGADLFVQPSLAEGISNTLLEAMASGLPLIATDVGGNHELLHPEHGALLPDLNVTSMVKVLAEYLSEPERMVREGEVSRRRTEHEFSLPKMISEYHGLYQSVLKHRGITETGSPAVEHKTH